MIDRNRRLAKNLGATIASGLAFPVSTSAYRSSVTSRESRDSRSGPNPSLQRKEMGHAETQP